MSNDINILAQTPGPGAFDADLVGHFASRQRIGTITTLVVTFAVAIVIWGHVPGAILIAWVTAQSVVAVFSMVRWNRFRQIDDSTVNARPLMVEAVALTAVSGALWGLLAVFSFVYLPQSLDLFTAIAVTAMAVGSVSTMAAIPAASYAFIILSFTPFFGFWLIGGDLAHVTLGLLAILLLALMVNSARVAHAQLSSNFEADFDHRRLSDEVETARGKWLELSDATEAYVLFDDQDRLIGWNERFAELMQIPGELLCQGTKRTDLIRNARQTIDVASGAISMEQWLRQRIGPTSSDADETSVREYDGGLWLQRRLRRTQNGNLVVSFVDWTDLVKMESALRDSEERYRLIAENSPDALFVRDEDKVVYANPAAVKLLRAKSETDLLGLSMISLYHPGDHNLILANKAKMAQHTGEPLPPTQARMRRLDGSYVMTAGAGANHIWQGQPAVLITRRDITAQIEAEERLRESEGRYRRIADLSPIAILIRVEDRIVYANPAAVKIFGAESEADLLYESMMSLVHPDDQHLVLNNRATMVEDSEDAAPTIKVRQQRFDGTYFYCEGSGAPFVWQGQPAVMVMWRDITAEAEAGLAPVRHDSLAL